MHFLQKQYAALVWISRPLENEDEDKLSSPRDLVIQCSLSLTIYMCV